MRISDHNDLKWGNWRRNATANFNIFQVATTGFLAACIPIIPEIRSMGDNLKHDLGMVVCPILIAVLNFAGLFVAKTKPNDE